MIDAEFAQDFAHDWVKAWNDHDLEAILSHYAEDVIVHSPRVRLLLGRGVGNVSGKPALREYWSWALDHARDLFFETDQVFVGSDALTIVYTNHRQQTVAETFVFNTERKVIRGIVAYV
jgi:hypothetical protein